MGAAHEVFSVPSLAAFKAIFYAVAGPVARITLPDGVYFSGSLCVAASTVPSQLRHLLPAVETLWMEKMRVPDYLLGNFLRKKLGTGCVQIVDSFYSLSSNLKGSRCPGLCLNTRIPTLQE